MAKFLPRLNFSFFSVCRGFCPVIILSKECLNYCTQQSIMILKNRVNSTVWPKTLQLVCIAGELTRLFSLNSCNTTGRRQFSESYRSVFKHPTAGESYFCLRITLSAVVVTTYLLKHFERAYILLINVHSSCGEKLVQPVLHSIVFNMVLVSASQRYKLRAFAAGWPPDKKSRTWPG